MSINVKENARVAVIEIEGKFLGSVGGPALKEHLEDLKEDGKTQVVVDLARTDFMDSTGVGALISGLTTMRRANGDVRLANLEKRIKNLFMMTHLLGPVFESYRSVEEAVESFEERPSAPPPSQE